MEVILREDVAGLGIIGEVVRVKPGYARNYLFPQGYAVLADRRNLGQLEHQKRIIAAKKARERGGHEATAKQLAAVSLSVEARAGKGGKLFGSVTNIDVQRLLAAEGFEIDRRRIELRDPIKEVGDYHVSIRVGQDVTAKVPLAVRPIGGELEQASPDEHADAADETEERKPRRKRAADHEEEEGSDDEEPS